MRSGKLIHRVTVMGPPGSRGTRGEVQGQPVVVLKDWPCSIETLSGTKTEQAHQLFAEATHKVKGYASKLHPFKQRDWLLFQGRKLFIGFINDLDMKGIEYELLVAELPEEANG